MLILERRFEEIIAAGLYWAQHPIPRPNPPQPPPLPFTTLAYRVFTNPAYGTLRLCPVPQTMPKDSASVLKPNPSCASFLDSYATKRILSVTDLTNPTYLISWKRGFSTHIRFAHWSGSIFKISVISSNAEIREAEGFPSGGDVLAGLDQTFEVEWVTGKEEGLAFRGNFWGMGEHGNPPAGKGKESAEVWFAKG